MIEWNQERIAKLSNGELRALQNNASKLGRLEIVDLCIAELTLRKPTKIRKERVANIDENRAGQYVAEFHFICPKELGVTRTVNGLVRTGTWVVSEENAQAAVKYGSFVALHTEKAELSYLQGIVKGWEKKQREPRYAAGQVVRTRFGIDFIFEPTIDPMPWKGEATGEKGYSWSPIP